MESITEINIIEEYIDPIGHVNNVRYVAFLEDARGEWFKKAGLSYDVMREKRVQVQKFQDTCK